MNLQAAQALDHADPLACYREEFHLAPEEVYLCGHSLGALPKRTVQQLAVVMQQQWGVQRAKAWVEADWINLPLRLGKRLAPLLGADPEEVVVADSTSANLIKLLIAGMKLRPGRSVILTDKDNFPADLYMAQAVADLLPGVEVIHCERSEIASQLNERTAILMLTQVDYRSSELYEMKRMTELAHAAGALMFFDLAHSAGILPLALQECQVDLAVGCGYKYLNGGPGAPAFLYVAKAHQEKLSSPLAGWMGHESPFEFADQYRPALGVRRFLCGTPAILSMSALEASIELATEVSLMAVRHKSQALGNYLIELMAEACPQLQLISPRQAHLRGGHVAFTHPEAARLEQALQAQGIVCDFRAPNVLRFGLASLYVRYVDLYTMVQILRTVLGGAA